MHLIVAIFKNENERWKHSYEYKHLQMNQIFTLNNPLGFEVLLNK